MQNSFETKLEDQADPAKSTTHGSLYEKINSAFLTVQKPILQKDPEKRVF